MGRLEQAHPGDLLGVHGGVDARLLGLGQVEAVVVAVDIDFLRQLVQGRLDLVELGQLPLVGGELLLERLALGLDRAEVGLAAQLVFLKVQVGRADPQAGPAVKLRLLLGDLLADERDLLAHAS